MYRVISFPVVTVSLDGYEYPGTLTVPEQAVTPAIVYVYDVGLTTEATVVVFGVVVVPDVVYPVLYPVVEDPSLDEIPLTTIL